MSYPDSHSRPALTWREALAEGVGAFLAYGAAALYFLRPLATVWRDHLAPDPGDPLFNLYVLKWGMHQARQGFPDPWDANLFHPLPEALTLSDHLFGPALLSLPVTELTGSAVAGYNFLLLLAFALTGAVTYLVLRAGGLGRTAAAVGGAVFVFMPYRWEQTSHLQVIFSPWLPAVLWTFDRLLVAPRPRRGAWFLLLYALHVTGGNYLAYMIHFPLAVLVLNRALEPEVRRRWGGRRSLVTLGTASVLAVSLLLTLFLPYLETSRHLGLERTTGEFQHYGANSVAYLTPSRFTAGFDEVAPVLRSLSPRFEEESWFKEKTLFPGVLPWLLAAVAAGALWRRYRRPPPPGLSDGRRAAVGGVVVAGVATFLAADLFTLGFLEPGGALRGQTGEIYSAFGLALVLLFALWAGLRWRWQMGPPVDLAAMPGWTRGLALATVCTFLLTFPVIFTPATELVPGLSGMRVPSRFHVFTAFGLAWLAALGLHGLLQRIPRPALRGAAGLLVGAVLLWELAPSPLPWFEVPLEEEFPPVYHWLADHRDEVGAVLELPLLGVTEEVRYLYYSTLHWQPLVNGYSGFLPLHYRYLRAHCCWPVPTPELTQQLQRLGVTHLVFHPVERERWSRRAFWDWQKRVVAGEVPGVRHEYESPEGSHVYSIARWPAPVGGPLPPG